MSRIGETITENSFILWGRWILLRIQGLFSLLNEIQ